MQTSDIRKMLEVLVKEFPPRPVPTLVQSMEIFNYESCEEMGMIEGKSWDQVYLNKSYMESHHSFPYWLTAKGLKYYMPAVIIYTYQFYEKYREVPRVADVVQYIFEDEKSRLSVCPESQMDDFFNLRQLVIIKEWLEFMREEWVREYLMRGEGVY